MTFELELLDSYVRVHGRGLIRWCYAVSPSPSSSRQSVNSHDLARFLRRSIAFPGSFILSVVLLCLTIPRPPIYYGPARSTPIGHQQAKIYGDPKPGSRPAS